MPVKIVKLINNEEVMGDIELNLEGDYEITNPVRIQVMPGKTGEPQVGFAPWPMFCEQKSGIKVTVSTLAVAYQYSPAQDFINHYNTTFGTGIVVPSQQIITG